jgi:hypothetical protein
MSTVTPNKINLLMQDSYSGKLYFSEYLKQKGYSDQLLKQYRQSGWLVALSKGVMYRKGGKLLAMPAVSCYNSQLHKHFRVAAHSALELYGFNHYVPMGKPVLALSHPKNETVPEWLKNTEFDRILKFFSTETFLKQELTTLNIQGVDILVSSPEQAFLECLLLAPKQYSFIDLFYIMEQLTTLRPEILQGLLENTDSQKIKRLFLYMAEKSGHFWFEMLDVTKIQISDSKHNLTENGVYLPKYKITIPKELFDYE